MFQFQGDRQPIVVARYIHEFPILFPLIKINLTPYFRVEMIPFEFIWEIIKIKFCFKIIRHGRSDIKVTLKHLTHARTKITLTVLSELGL